MKLKPFYETSLQNDIHECVWTKVQSVVKESWRAIVIYRWPLLNIK